jgi:hypothetical protein
MKKPKETSMPLSANETINVFDYIGKQNRRESPFALITGMYEAYWENAPEGLLPYGAVFG